MLKVLYPAWTLLAADYSGNETCSNCGFIA